MVTGSIKFATDDIGSAVDAVSFLTPATGKCIYIWSLSATAGPGGGFKAWFSSGDIALEMPADSSAGASRVHCLGDVGEALLITAPAGSKLRIMYSEE
jgi:hypothetical protein